MSPSNLDTGANEKPVKQMEENIYSNNVDRAYTKDESVSKVVKG